MIRACAAAGGAEPDPTESTAAWLRLTAAVVLSTIGGVGMWSVVVALPAIQAEFGVDRAAASMPYTLTMLGFAAGGVVMGRLADRFGITVPIIVSTRFIVSPLDQSSIDAIGPKPILRPSTPDYNLSTQLDTRRTGGSLVPAAPLSV